MAKKEDCVYEREGNAKGWAHFITTNPLLHTTQTGPWEKELILPMDSITSLRH
jgi:hypothetical protein